MKTVKTFLPVFPGFYNTIFEADETFEIDRINETREENGLDPIEYNDLVFDYDKYNEEISKGAVNFIERELKRLGIVKSIKFEALHSPREYNFANDTINVEIEVNTTLLTEYLTSFSKELQTYLKENYSSCSGFISFHSNNIDEWIKETNNFSEFNDFHKLGALLDFIFKNEGITQDDMYNSIDNVSLECKNYDEAITLVKE